MLTLITAPASEPLTTAEAKSHLRVTASDEDTLIAAWIEAARMDAEAFTGRAFITQTWELKLDAFPPEDCAIVLPKPPCASITSITYLDDNGASQTWSSLLYRTSLPAGPRALPAKITPAYLESYPTTRPVMNAVTIRFVAGTATAPAAVKAAVALMVGYLYEHRVPDVTSRRVDDLAVTYGKVGDAVARLLWPFVVPKGMA